MKLLAFIEGLQILAPYYEGGDGYHLGAEHDIFYAYATAKPLPETAVTKMYELGWFQPDVEEVEDDKPGPYDPEEGWAAYV